MRWRLRPCHAETADALSEAAGLPRALAAILVNRGVSTAAETARYLRPTTQAFGDPRRLRDMDAAVQRIRQAVAAREPIRIFADSDTDGLTASTILDECLRQLGASVAVQHANRITDGYGVPESCLDAAVSSGAGLAIFVDCGTNQPEAVERLRLGGITVIVLDHHAPAERAAEPLALVNPWADPSGAGRELCSAGLAFALAAALLGSAERAEGWLDLAAIGTLADCSPLCGDSRTLVALGLPRIIGTTRLGLRRLCEATGLDRQEPEQVVRRLVPRLNAAGRLGNPEAIWRLLRADGEACVDSLARSEQAHADVKRRHRRAVGEAMDQVSRMHFRDQHVVVVSGEGWHQGVMGPLAAQLANQFGRPAIAIALNEGEGVGSGRSVPSVDLLDLLRQCEELLIRFGGHAQACGLTLGADQIRAFEQRINAQAGQSTGQPLGSVLDCDLELPLAAMEVSWVDRLRELRPHGMGNPAPLVILRNVEVGRNSPRRGWVSDGRRRVALHGQVPESAGQRYDVVVTPGIVSGELVLALRDVKLATEPSPHGQT